MSGGNSTEQLAVTTVHRLGFLFPVGRGGSARLSRESVLLVLVLGSSVGQLNVSMLSVGTLRPKERLVTIVFPGYWGMLDTGAAQLQSNRVGSLASQSIHVPLASCVFLPALGSLVAW